jgi:hypothetical protein
MPAHRLLYLTQHQLLAYDWRAGHCTLEAEFAVDVAGADFLAYLRKNRSSLFSFVANLAEEGFQVETIPFLQGRDRETVLARRLGQTFLGAPLTVAVPLGHEKNTRRNEIVLLAALSNGAALEPWLQALRAAEARLAGIFSLPLLTPGLLDKLHVPRDRCIFVTVQDNSVRQSFFDKGHLHFSRLAPIPNSSISGLAQLIGTEIAKLQQYLLSQRTIGRNEPLVAHVLAHPQAVQALQALALPEHLRLQTYSIIDAGRRLGLKESFEDSRAHPLFLQMAAAFAPRQQFAPSALRKDYRLWQASRAIQALASIGLLGSLLFAGKGWLNLQQVAEETRQQEVQAESGERRYREIVAAFPKLPLSQEHLRLVINRFNEAHPYDLTPIPLFKALGAALTRAPQVELTSIDWSVGNPTDDKRTSAASAIERNKETLQVNGLINLGPNGTPRQMLTVFDGFVADLSANGSYAVAVRQQPFDTGSGSSLKSGESANTASQAKPFSLSVSRRLGP